MCVKSVQREKQVYFYESRRSSYSRQLASLPCRRDGKERTIKMNRLIQIILSTIGGMLVVGNFNSERPTLNLIIGFMILIVTWIDVLISTEE